MPVRKKAPRGPVTAADRTYEQLEELIVLTRIKPGILYTEKELAELVEAGRTPVREALQRLVAEGLVSFVPQRGVLITDVDVDVQLRLLEVRRPIQNFAVECGAERASAENRKELTQFADELDAIKAAGGANRVQILALVRKAHDLIVNVSKNEFIPKTLRVVQGLSRRFWMYYVKPEDFPPAAEIHSRLLRAVADGDAEKAVTASNALIDYLEAFARKTVRWE
jgi:DNA-binding GntR family transcriptional regulator